MGIFLFSEAFLSREATARGTPREKSTWCRSYQVISSSFTRLHSVVSPLQFFSLYLSLLFPFYQFTNNCSTDLGIVVINRSLVRRTNEWCLTSWKQREKEREREREEKGKGRRGEKKIIIPLFSSHSSLFCLRPCSLKKRGETNTRPDRKRACCAPFKVAGKLGTRSSEKSLVTTRFFTLQTYFRSSRILLSGRSSFSLSSHRFIMPIIEEKLEIQRRIQEGKIETSESMTFLTSCVYSKADG